MPGRRLGRQFGWLWAAFAASSYGTGLGFGAFPLIAVLVLHSGPAQVAALAATGRVVGALVAVPLGPWVEFRPKRPVMMTMDLIRFTALMSVPAAFALGRLSFAQLLIVSVVTAAADIAFRAASGAYLKALLPPEDLLVANSRFESTTWASTTLGPPLGGAAMGVLGPVATVVADALSYLLSALGIRAIGGTEQCPVRPAGPTGKLARAGELLEGFRYILTHPMLRPLFFNSIAVNGLIMVSEPLLVVLLVDHFGFAPWQYGLAFAAPCIGGLIGSRLARGLETRFGRRRMLLGAGTLRACWPVGLVFVQPGVPGLVLIIAVQLGLVTFCGLYAPVLATYRLDHTAPDRVARVLAAWSVSSNTAIAALTALWGLLAAATSPRTAIAAAGLLLLATPLLLPRRSPAPQDAPGRTPSGTLGEPPLSHQSTRLAFPAGRGRPEGELGGEGSEVGQGRARP